MKNVPLQSAMAFYHEDGLVPAWKHAIKFSGKGGHVGTMLDVVDARIAAGVNDFPWNTYFTTTSAEYFGYSRSGKRILIVAHGIGPMSTLEGIQKAYSYEYKDKTRSNRGGRISQEEFWALEDGKYGDVSIVEFDPLIERYEYPFMEYLTAADAALEPLMLARLGPRALEYLEHHEKMAQEYHCDEHKRSIKAPYILQMGDASNCSYEVGGWEGTPRRYPQLDKGDGAVAQLLSTGALANVHHQSKHNVSSLANDIACHEWWNGVRFVAVCENGDVTNIHPGFGNVRLLIRKNWKSLMKKVEKPVFPGNFYAIMSGEGDELFTQYPKKGARMDTHEPEFHITKVEKIGKLAEFVTTVDGYHGFFKYDIKEVYAMKPREANAYAVIGDPTIIYAGNPTNHRVDVQFYRIEINTSQRLVRDEELRNDFDMLMKLSVDKQVA